ncbi:glycosyltransferase [Pseudoalteromonas arctica]|uniref:Glycosyltransferase family 2 protein n=1 Tax=Pseudoalteromonas arctica TaxID=394751 RepID=A0A7Y0DWJ0_9GAMM|nr:glycosyltransferase family A protein [Pseudoalteromonas arctica]NMM42046.1 glycosyltransferase family 2 protein [Pseudoalteromonas arctica]
MLNVTVIIPTYYDWERLQLCLHALSKQSYPQEYFEIIVVNNAPKDKAPENLIIPNNCILLDEAKPGSYAARNKALKIAKGDIYAFTDSDCQPKEDWLEVAINFFIDNTEVERIGGEISLFTKNEKANWFEIYEMFFAFPQKEFVTIDGMAATGNMISKKEAFDKVGNFDANLMSGGDGEWGRRAQKAASQISYLKDCIVYHPTRSSSKDILTKNKRLAGGYLSVAKKRGASSVVSLLVKGLIPPITAIKRALNKKDQPSKNKAIAILVCYYLKLSATFEVFRLLTGLSEAERI